MDEYEKLYTDILDDCELMLRYIFSNDKRTKEKLKKDKKTIKKFKKRFDNDGLSGLFEE